MKKIFLLIAAPFIFFTAFSAPVTQEEADGIVLERMNQETRSCTVYAKEGVQKEMIITSSAGELLEINYFCWVYYVRYTDTNQGRYLIVKESNWKLLEVDAKNGAEPGDLAVWRIVGIIDDEEFCSYVNLKNIDKTIPVVNKYLCSLAKDLSEEQKMQALVTWFKSYSCIIDARIILSDFGYPPRVGAAFSFMEDEIVRELILDFSTTKKVVSYHYDIVNGASVKAKADFTIDKVFDFINSLDFDVTLIYNGVYVSNMAPNNLQYILNSLNAKPYTNDGNAWKVTGYLHYLTNQITIFPRLYNIKNRNYQTDWLKSMNDYELIERGGYIIRFQIPEDPENKGVPKFEEYDFVEWVELSHNRYTIYDKSIETGSDACVNVSVDSKISIRMVEISDISPRTLQFYCSTAMVYPCVNYPIYAVHQQSSNSIDISFKGVIENIGICLTAIGPATTVIDLGTLSNGTYILNLHNGDVTHTGELIVSSDSYKINFADNSDFHFTNTPLNKMPEQIIWGTVGYHKQETLPLVQSFLTGLMDLGAEKRPYNPGYYREFEIDGNGDIVQPGEGSGYYFAQSFIFNYSGDIMDIEQLVKQYARDYGNDYMYISVYTDKGEKFLSWMYK
jgi:hypothetical protein